MDDALQRVFEQYRFRPFEWGAHDCAYFAARCVDAQRGNRNLEQHLMTVFRYNSPLSALRVMMPYQGQIEPFVTQLLGSPTQESLGRGDVVLVKETLIYGERLLLGVLDHEWLVVPDSLGLSWVAPNQVQLGWKACPQH